MSIKVWEKRIASYDEGAPITNSLINQVRSIFNRSMMSQAHEVQLLMEEHALYQYGDGPGWSITPEQERKGLEWMKRSNVVKYFREKEKRIMADFDHFTFEGVLLGWEGLRQNADIVYRVWAKNGSYFDYTASPWQQGTKHPFRILTEDEDGWKS